MQNKAHLYLRKAADEAAVSAGVVLSVQAVVEEAGVTGGHVVRGDVELRLDAAPQVGAAAGELSARTHTGPKLSHFLTRSESETAVGV